MVQWRQEAIEEDIQSREAIWERETERDIHFEKENRKEKRRANDYVTRKKENDCRIN